MEQGTLLRRIGQCDAVALAQVYDDHHQCIYRYIYGYLGREAAAEDVTATVFFRFLRAVRSGNSPRSNLSGWLYRVAHNSVMDVFRRMPPEELELTEWLECSESDPAHAAERHIEMERVRVALCALTEGQRQVIVLKFLQGMDSREVGAIMGRSEGAVDALQQCGMRALRRALQQQPR